MLKVRLSHTLPFALLASMAACSSSSSGTTPEVDSGTTKDTGTTSHPDTGTTITPDGGTVHDGGTTKDTGTTPPPSDGGNASCPTPPSGATAILTKQFVQAEGITTDGYLVYFDSKGGVSVVGTTGAPVQIAPGPQTDGGISPEIAGISGNLVFLLTDYTTKSVMGTPEAIAGTLSVWSHTQTAGVVKQVATNATGVISIAADSSYFIYADGSNAAGTVGNLGIAAGAGTGATDFVTNVAIDLTSTTCAPWATVTNGSVVASTCAALDGGTGTPTIASYTGASYTRTVLTTTGTISTPFEAPGNVNFATDTAGDNVITEYNVGTPAVPTLAVQGLTSTTPVVLQTPFTAPVSGATTGTEFFYMSKASTYALFTEPTGALGIANFATPTTAPVISTLAAGPVLGVQGVSPDDGWILDYNTALDSTTGAPTSLNLRSTSTGTATPLIASGSGTVSGFGAGNSFTTDSKYAVFTTDLKMNSVGTTGTLFTAAVATGTVNKLVTNQSVWLASPLSGGDNLIYNQNYLVNTLSNEAFGGSVNGGASADIYVVPAAGPGPGTLVVSQADAPEDALYATTDGHLFFTYTQLVTADGGAALCETDGLYVMTLPQ